MKPITPTPHEGAVLIVLGADQPQYDPLPCARSADGLILTEWEFSAEDLEKIFSGGRLRMWTHTFGTPFQPVSVEIVA